MHMHRLARFAIIGVLAASLSACGTERAIEEEADVLYHTLVTLRSVGASLDDVRRVLASRRRD